MGALGHVTLVGAGPGDPGLITVRGLAALRAADVVVYDHLAAPLLECVPAAAEKIYVGKQRGEHTLPQDEINRLLADLAAAGRRVVRLKGGDPYVFGRGAEEACHLAARGIPFAVIPGIPAAVGAAAYAGVPLTDRRETAAVTFVTGHEDAGKAAAAVDWGRLAAAGGTLVIYMGVRNLAGIVAQLLAHGRDPATPAALIEWATTPRQRTANATVADLPRLADAMGLNPPALIVIGTVARWRAELAWFERLPLFGKRLIVTRQTESTADWLEPLRALGADAVALPTIRIEPPADPAALQAAAARVAAYDWVVFTSANGVAHFWRALRTMGRDARAFASVRIAAVGPGTAAELAARGLTADFVPTEYTTAALGAELQARENLAGLRFLLARSDLAPPALAAQLRAAGALVTEVQAYRTVPETAALDELRTRLAAGTCDAVLFTSASTVRFLVAGLGAEFVSANRDRIPAFSIGPETSKALRDCGLAPRAEAAPHDRDGLTRALLCHFHPQP